MELDTKVAINNIIDLIKKDGVFYALLFTLFEDSHIHISELDSFDPNLRISADEAHWLIGFMIQHNPSFVDSFPKTIGDLLALSKDIHKALKELELSYVRKTSLTDEYFNSQHQQDVFHHRQFPLLIY